MVAENMHVALRSLASNIQKDPDIDDITLLRKTLKDYGASSVTWRVYDRRSTDVIFVVLECNGLQGLLVLPQKYLYHKIPGESPQLNVNGFRIRSLLPLTSPEFTGQKIQRLTYINSSLESILSRSSLHHADSLNNVNKWDTLSSTSSSQNPIIECEFPGTISSESGANGVEEIYVHEYKENISINGYSRKKPKKKGKRNRNLKCSNGNELQSAVGCSITESVQQNIRRSASSSANSCNSMSNDVRAVSSISLGSNSDGRFGPIVRQEVSSNGDILDSAGERNKCLRQHDRSLYATEKKDKYFRRATKDSNVYASSNGNHNGHSKKENYQFIWQRVQRNDADVSKCDLEKVNFSFSQVDDRLKKNPLKKMLPDPVESVILSQSQSAHLEKLKVRKNLRRNKSPGSLQENISQCQKGSVNGLCSNASLKTNMQSNDVSGSASQVAGAKSSINAANSRTGTSSYRARYKKRDAQYVSSKPIPIPEAFMLNLEATENFTISAASLDNQIVEHQIDLLSRSEKFHDLTEHQGELLRVDGEGDEMDKEISPSCQIKHEHNTVPRAVSKSSMPKDSDLPKCKPVGMLVEAENWTSKNVREINAGQNAENIKALPGDTHSVEVRNLNTLEKGCNNAAMAKFFVPESKTQTIRNLENNLRNIPRAVNDAHKAQLASKAIEVGNGYPTAEFEKLLHSAAPVICPSISIRTCQVCSSGQGTDAPLCRHEIPNMSLGNLWQWYEKHGSYGLEVKAEDHRNARWYGMDRFRFRAYFVPYLSAIQLFGNHRTHPNHNDIRTIGSVDVLDCEVNKVSDCSPNGDLHSILSVLVPQPLIGDSSANVQEGAVSDSASSLECSNGDSHHLRVDDDMDLLFEYFESEQPQKRQPLFETIQKLVSGDGPSNCRSYGDPSILQSVNLHDLHPHSWFSVAWYPIYKIPDGNLRSAFLTYHSLGHFIHSNHTVEACCVDDHVVSPTVGLQSYNAQGECWFQPRHPADDLTEESLDMDLRTVLQDRLRTLEQTASIMSRAVRKGGSDMPMNIHPDYEFFLSRRR